MYEFSKPIESVLDISEILEKADAFAELSPSLSESIQECKKILIILGTGIDEVVAESFLHKCGEKLGGILCQSECLVGEKYKDKILTLNPHDIKNYSYFGATNSKAPILLHNIIFDFDLIMSLSELRYDGLGGFSGAPLSAFTSLSASKAITSLTSKCLDLEGFIQKPECAVGQTLGNPFDLGVKEALIASSSVCGWFGVNLLKSGGNVFAVTSGDILLSYVNAQRIYDDENCVKIDKLYDGMSLEIKSGSMQDNLWFIKSALTGLMKGGRLLIKAPNMKVFGTGEFREYFNYPTIENVFQRICEPDCQNAYDAFSLKKLCMTYHIAIDSLLNSADVIQCGLNPISCEDYEAFLNNCSNTVGVCDAKRFTVDR